MYDGRHTYPFEAALEGATSGPRSLGAERVFDRRSPDAPQRETSCWATIVGLFDGNQCRRCGTTFNALASEPDWRPGHEGEILSGKEAHRVWHEWRDENESGTEAELDLACFAASKPPAGYILDAGNRVLELVSPTPAQLQRHREKFEPQGKTFAAARKAHNTACDEIARLYNLTGDDIGRMLLDLREEGLSIPEIAERLGVAESKVRDVLRKAA